MTKIVWYASVGLAQERSAVKTDALIAAIYLGIAFFILMAYIDISNSDFSNFLTLFLLAVVATSFFISGIYQALNEIIKAIQNLNTTES